jgi:hypothetical protein
MCVLIFGIGWRSSKQSHQQLSELKGTRSGYSTNPQASTRREGRVGGRDGTLPEPRKPVMTVAGTRVSSACASKAALERPRKNLTHGGGGGRRSGGARARKHLEKESRGPRAIAVLAALGSSCRAAAAAMSTG